MTKALENKEFRDMLFQYMNEISDPAHRAEQEVLYCFASRFSRVTDMLATAFEATSACAGVPEPA
jgi:hypothetical protein